MRHMNNPGTQQWWSVEATGSFHAMFALLLFISLLYKLHQMGKCTLHLQKEYFHYFGVISLRLIISSCRIPCWLLNWFQQIYETFNWKITCDLSNALKMKL